MTFKSKKQLDIDYIAFITASNCKKSPLDERPLFGDGDKICPMGLINNTIRLYDNIRMTGLASDKVRQFQNKQISSGNLVVLILSLI